MQGFLNINKQSGVTSAYVVGQIKKHFHISKVGHMGTLDPLASGVLPIALGKATRLFDYMQQKTKEYVTVIRFGVLTNTLDITGQITNTCTTLPTLDQVQNAIKLLIGTYNQVPPQFSAKKVGGKKAYELARQNIEVNLKPKQITIYNFTLIKQLSDTDYEFSISCSSGTYIRSIARDLGSLLNSFGTMVSLVRTKTGIFDIKQSYTLEQILANNSKEYGIMKVQDVLPNIKSLTVSEQEFNALQNGITVLIKNLTDEFYFINYNNQLLGIGQHKNGALKLKTFLLEN